MKIPGIAVFLAKLAFTAGAVLVVAHTIPLGSLAEKFSHIHWFWLAMASLFLFAEFVVAAAKVHWMVGAGSLGLQFRILTTKIFVNHLLPSGIGGEAARLLGLGRLLQSMGRGLGVITADRWSGLCTQSLWSGLGLWVVAGFPQSPLPYQDKAMLAGSVLVAAGGMGWFLGPRLMAWAALRIPWTQRWGPLKSLGEEAGAFAGEVRFWGKAHRRSWKLFLWSCCNQATMVLLLLAANRAWGDPLNPWLASAIMLLGSLSVLVPVTLGGLGVQEGFFGFAFHLAGAGVEQGIGVSLLLRVIMLPAGILGAWFFLRDSGSRDRLSPRLDPRSPGFAPADP